MIKKSIIILIIFSLVIGGYFVVNKAKESATYSTDKELNKFIQKHYKQTINFYPLPFFVNEKVNWQIISFTKDQFNSVLTLVSQDRLIKYPLTSKIMRGKIKYKDKLYDFGKIITRIDVSKQNTTNTENNIINTTYLSKKGEITNVFTIHPQILTKISNNKIFADLEVIFTTNIANYENFNININSRGAEFKDIKTFLGHEFYGKVNPFTISVQGNYNNIKLTGKIPWISIEKKHPNHYMVELKGGKLEANGHYSSENKMMLGQYGISYDFIHINDDFLAIPIKLDNIKFKIDLIPADDAFNAFIKLSSNINGKIIKKAELFPIELNQIKSNSRISKLTIDNLNNYKKILFLYAPYFSYNKANKKAVNIKEDREQFKGKMLDLLNSILKNDKVNIISTVKINTKKGNTDATIELENNGYGSRLKAKDFINKINKLRFFEIIRLVNAKLTLNMDKTLKNSIPIFSPKVESFFKQDGDNLKINIIIKNGTINVNGKRRI